MSKGSFSIEGGIPTILSVNALAMGDVVKTVVNGGIILRDDLLRSDGAGISEARRHRTGRFFAALPGVEYATFHSLLSGGHRGTSIAIRNGFAGMNRDEFESDRFSAGTKARNGGSEVIQ